MPRFCFFTALNPLSPHPGINSSLIPWKEEVSLAKTIRVIGEYIWINPNPSFHKKIGATFEMLMGHHYWTNNHVLYRSTETRKGVLDFFILPLLARVLICNLYPPKDQAPKHILQQTVEWSMAIFIALPIEIIRFTVAVALTIALIPVVALVHIAINIRDGMKGNMVEFPSPAGNQNL